MLAPLIFRVVLGFRVKHIGFKGLRVLRFQGGS